MARLGAGRPDGAAGAGKSPPGADLSVPFKEAKEKLIADFSRAYLTALYEKCDGNLSKMSREAGIARHYLRELLGRYKLRVEDD